MDQQLGSQSRLEMRKVLLTRLINQQRSLDELQEQCQELKEVHLGLLAGSNSAQGEDRAAMEKELQDVTSELSILTQRESALRSEVEKTEMLIKADIAEDPAVKAVVKAP
jgi:hypothetical protein